MRTDSPQPYGLLVMPADAMGPHGGRGTGRVIVLIGDPEARVESPPEVLARVYGLTPTEARLAHALASGDPLETYAERAGIALSTARWTLKQVQAKTGCRRQADLVRLVLTGPASWGG